MISPSVFAAHLEKQPPYLTHTALKDVAHVDLLNLFRLDAGIFDCLFHRCHAQLRGLDVLESAVERSNGCARGTADVNFRESAVGLPMEQQQQRKESVSYYKI